MDYLWFVVPCWWVYDGPNSSLTGLIARDYRQLLTLWRQIQINTANKSSRVSPVNCSFSFIYSQSCNWGPDHGVSKKMQRTRTHFVHALFWYYKFFFPTTRHFLNPKYWPNLEIVRLWFTGNPRKALKQSKQTQNFQSRDVFGGSNCKIDLNKKYLNINLLFQVRRPPLPSYLLLLPRSDPSLTWANEEKQQTKQKSSQKTSKQCNGSQEYGTNSVKRIKCVQYIDKIGNYKTDICFVSTGADCFHKYISVKI